MLRCHLGQVVLAACLLPFVAQATVFVGSAAGRMTEGEQEPSKPGKGAEEVFVSSCAAGRRLHQGDLAGMRRVIHAADDFRSATPLFSFRRQSATPDRPGSEHAARNGGGGPLLC